MSTFWLLLELKMMDVQRNLKVYMMCKAPVKSTSATNQHSAFSQAGCPSYCPTSSVKAPKENVDSHALYTLFRDL